MDVRPFLAVDYPALLGVMNRAYPQTSHTLEELRYTDERFGDPYRRGRWVAVLGEEMIGYCEFSQSTVAYHPQKYDVDVIVTPEYQGRGIGSALYTKLMAMLVPLRPLALRAAARETPPRQLRFYEARGFEERFRSWHLHLDVQNFDPTRYAELWAKLKAQGFGFLSVAEVEAATRNRELYELLREIVTDVPSLEPRTPWTYEQFLQHRENAPNLLPEASFVVVKDGMLVGVSEFKKTQEDIHLYTSLTGVRRDFRHLGLALAVKAKAISHAKERGIKVISTRNASTNSSMLKLNEALGFERGPAEITLVKVMAEGQH